MKRSTDALITRTLRPGFSGIVACDFFSVDTVLFRVCPNCGGGFVPRLIRPVTERRQGLSLAKRPASTERVYLSYEKDEIDRFARIVRDIPPESR